MQHIKPVENISLCLMAISFFLTLNPVLLKSQPRGEKYQYVLQEEIEVGSGVRSIVYTDKSETTPIMPKHVLRVQEEKSTDGKIRKKHRLTDISNDIPIGNAHESGDRITISDLGNYFYTDRKVAMIEQYASRHLVSFYETPSTFLWSKDFIVGDESGDIFFISDHDGTVVECNTGLGVLKFYSKEGVLIKEHPLFGTIDRYYGIEGATGKFSRNGNNFVFICYGIEESEFSNGSAMFMFDTQGNMLWQFDPPEMYGSTSALSISNDGSYIISYFFTNSSGGDVVYLHGIKGTLIKKFVNLAAGKVVFSQTDHYAALYQSNRMWLIDLTAGELAMERYFAPNGRRIWDIDISEELGVVVLIEGRYLPITRERSVGVHSNGKIRVVNFNKRPVAEMDLPDREVRINDIAMRPQISISRDGGKIGANWGTKYYVYNLNK